MKPDLIRQTYRLVNDPAELGRRHIHKTIMASSDIPGGHHDSPRAYADMLWYITDEPGTDPLITVQSRYPLTLPSWLATDPGEPLIYQSMTSVDALPGVIELTGTVSMTYTPMVSIDPAVRTAMQSAGVPVKARGRRTPVPAQRRHEWAHDLFARRGINVWNRGFDTYDLRVDKVADTVLDTRRAHQRIPTAHITLMASTTGPDTRQTLDDLFTTGIGHGRNYGLGLINCRDLPELWAPVPAVSTNASTDA